MHKTWRIAPPLALATTLHAMVLTGVVQWRGGDAGAADGRALAQAASLSVRLASRAPEPPAPTRAPAPVTTHPADAPLDSPVATTLADTSGDPAQVQPMSPTPAPTVEAATATSEASAEPSGPDPASDRYHARRELSRPPKPLSPIDIVFPPGVPTPGRHKAVLAVYIDEMGHVRKVHTEGESLPLAFEDAARNAFLSAQFRAGELEGRAVKSYIHIEVVFDEQPEARGLAVSSLGQLAP